MTKQEILEKHYTKYEKRIGYPDNVFAAMEEYAQQQVKIFSSNLPVSKSLFSFLKWYKKQPTPHWAGLERTINKYVEENNVR